MIRKNRCRSYGFMMCAVPLLLALLISCVGSVKEDEPPLHGRIMAENSSIKKRLPLIERENDVLRKENLQHRTKILDLDNQIKKLRLELDFLSEKYDIDMANGQDQIRGLQLAIQKIENESAARIKALISARKAFEKKSARKIHALNKNNAVQKKAFDQERQQIMKAKTAQELNLSNKIKSLTKTIKTKDMEKSALEKTNREISTKLVETSALVETLRKARDKSLAELELLKATNAKLTKALNSL